MAWARRAAAPGALDAFPVRWALVRQEAVRQAPVRGARRDAVRAASEPPRVDCYQESSQGAPRPALLEPVDREPIEPDSAELERDA